MSSEFPTESIETPTPNAEVGVENTTQPAQRYLKYRVSKRGGIRPLLHVIRNTMIGLKRRYFVHVLGMDIHPSCRFSLKANLDRTNPKGVHVGEGTYLAFGSVVLAHDMSRLVSMDTRIGKNCFIGAHAIVLPGVTIGDQCIVGAGSVVTRDIPSHSLCGGNPAVVLRSGIRTSKDGILEDVYRAALAASTS